MSAVSNLISQIDKGRSGTNHGCSLGLPKLEGVIDGLTRQTYTLIMSGSGSGKTSLVLYSYVYRPLMEHLDDDNFKCTYFSLEMNAEMILGKLLSMYIFEKYGIQLSLKEIFSRKRGYILSDEYYAIVKECLPWLEKVQSKLFIYDKGLDADSFYAILMKALEKYGTFEETDTRKLYHPNNPNLIWEVVIDHIGLLRPKKGRSKKDEIDLCSSYAVTLRNMCGLSFTFLSQVNRDASSTERRKFGNDIMNYQLSDAKDSGGPTEDAEIVLSIFNPNKSRLNNYKGYNISQLGDSFRSITVLKSRYGEVDVEVGCNFFGNIGIWKELPKGDEIYNYERYTNANYLLEEEVNEIDENTETDSQSSQYTFTL